MPLTHLQTIKLSKYKRIEDYTVNYRVIGKLPLLIDIIFLEP
jgi:hypothetical protein